MTHDRFKWAWRGQPIEVGLEMRGDGPAVLMLPALSSISTRAEMRPLTERLTPIFKTIAVDWPGFGDLLRPPIAWEPNAYRAFLAFILEMLGKPFAIVAAGHGAGYLIGHVSAHPGSAGRLCLVAPTWRGPLPTMMGGRRTAFRYLSRLVDLPVVGSALYRLNVNAPMIRMMGRGHVYCDPNWLDGLRLAEKRAVTKAPGARHASFHFVTGELDPMPTRDAFLVAAQRIVDPILVVCGADTPRRSKAEMEALGHIGGVQFCELAAGKLSVHEEFPNAVAEVLLPFLRR